MAADKRDWSVPAPLRALLWWPGTAFVLVMIDPETAAGSIAASGAVLVALGALMPVLARRMRRLTGGAPAQDPPTAELPTTTLPRVVARPDPGPARRRSTRHSESACTSDTRMSN
jgi:hypothetical protein